MKKLDLYAEKQAEVCYKSGEIPAELYKEFGVKRGLRDLNGQGVVTGITNISQITAFKEENGEKIPCDGELLYRGYDIRDLVEGAKKHRDIYEEGTFLLLFSKLPNKEELKEIKSLIAENMVLPKNFTRDVIMKAPDTDIMSSMTKSILTLASYDKKKNDLSVANVLSQSLRLIAQFPMLAIYGYHAYNHFVNDESMFIHRPDHKLSVAENFLRMLRHDKSYTEKDAHLLDLLLMIQAEHGGGNNSAFVCRTLASSGTDTYSVIAGAVGSLKGPLHGGANAKVMEMFDYVKNDVKDWNNDEEISDYLKKLIRKEAGDRSGKIYGLGHAVYTISDPRAKLIKKYAAEVAEEKGFLEEFRLLEKIETLGVPAVMEEKNLILPICANVDLYTGMIYRMLGIPEDLCTPLFAIARIAGWCAHRMEEAATGDRLIRPAYRAAMRRVPYVPIEERK